MKCAVSLVYLIFMIYKNAVKNQALLRGYLKGSKKKDEMKILWTDETKEKN